MPDLYAEVSPPDGKARGALAGFFGGSIRRIAAIIFLALTTLPVLLYSAGTAAAQTKSLKLYYVHTGERATITFKRNGRFDPKGLKQINYFLRDWRRNEPTRMDPRLFDLVWEVYRRSGAKDYIHVVSAYRAPATNKMLRSRSRNSGVAKNSQHTLGKAMDFYIPGVKISTLRALAMQMQVGGVGYYPKSGSPFVHLDVGSVRAWPRMSRQQLVSIFPKGNTIHLPADGKPLPGYDKAMADYKKRARGDTIEIASTAGGSSKSTKRQPNLFTFLFGGGGADEEEDNEEISVPVATPRPPSVAKPAPEPAESAEILVASAPPAETLRNIAAPIPLSRPAFRPGAPINAAAPASASPASRSPGGLATALYSSRRDAAQEALALQASAVPRPDLSGAAAPRTDEAFVDLAGYSIPVPKLLGPRGQSGSGSGGLADEAGVMTASVSSTPEDLTAIPLPARRPGVALAEASGAPVPDIRVASRQAPAKGRGQKDEGQELTPELIADLLRDAEPAAPVPAPQAMLARKPTRSAAVETASVDIGATAPRVIRHSGKDKQFGDGFDMPRPPVSASTGALPSPAKRGRVSDPADEALTKDMLADWALNTNRAETTASMKAPRVVSRTLNDRYLPDAAAGGFKPVEATVQIDTGRFGY